MNHTLKTGLEDLQTKLEGIRTESVTVTNFKLFQETTKTLISEENLKVAKQLSEKNSKLSQKLKFSDLEN